MRGESPRSSTAGNDKRPIKEIHHDVSSASRCGHDRNGARRHDGRAATVDVYGVVDTGLHYVKADSGDTSVTMDSGISKGSRVGLIGSEDLGGRYKIVFNLETGFSLDDGSFDNTKNRLVNPPRPIINWTGLPCLLPARTA